MAYVALYRKYRSQSFDELMGQEQVTRTLQNAVRSGRIAHAYLFYGARGCGKTSTARLLARALNCVAQDGPTPEPCGECRLCLAIRDGACLDVIEMDAASETGIDDVREKIIENVQYAPGEARYKVYIIDEVHDLSAKAFDALLKTLEEPPPHVVFILATTELHKVPITIRSRCQPYHFKRGSLLDLSAAVKRVIEAEGYEAEPDAILSIARSAEGSWRDALSILEQVLAYSEGVVTAETVHRAVGTVGTETLARVTEILAGGKWDETLAVAADLISGGRDARQLLTALTGHLRDLMLIAAGANKAAEQELGADRIALLQPQAKLFAPSRLLWMMGEISQAEREARFTNQHRWLLERTLLRLLTPEPNPPTPFPNSLTAFAGKGEKNALVLDSPFPVGAPLAAPANESGKGAGGVRESLSETPTAIPKPPIPRREETPSPYALAADDERDEPEIPAPRVITPAPSASEPEPAPSRFAEGVSLEVVQRSWQRILKEVRRKSPVGAPFLEKASVAGLEGKIIVLTFAEAFARDRIHGNAKGRATIEAIINQVLSSDGYKIRCEMAGGHGGHGGDTPAPVPTLPAPPPTLLDAPAVAQPTATRIADFEISTEPTPAPISNGAGTNGAHEPSPAPEPAPPPAADDFLSETLDIFGGEVIGSEPA